MFYVAHRLFAAHDRHLGALAARQLAATVGADNVFLPFCDTHEEDLQADVKGRRLYELDCIRLNQLRGMLAILHGPSLDDGVCMEIGYAAALGIPVVVLTTDFQTYGLQEDGPHMQFADPLVEGVATKIVRVNRLGPPPVQAVDRFDAFGQRNRRQVDEAVDRAAAHLVNLAQESLVRPDPPPADDGVFVEVSPYYSGTDTWEKILAGLEHAAGRAHIAARFSQRHQPFEAARGDWAALARCHTLLADVAGPETPPGAALMIGATVARGRQIIVVHTTSQWTFAAGREPNWRNLMIQYSVDVHINDVDRLSELLRP